MKMPILLIILMLPISLGCIESVYELELTPHGETMDRKLTVWRQRSENQSDNTPIPDAEIQRLSQIYKEQSFDNESRKWTFQDRFQGSMPADFDDAGGFHRFASPVGSLFVYRERFRGDDALTASLAQRQAKVDRLVDLLLRFVQEHVELEGVRDKLTAFIDSQFRSDLKNLNLHIWVYSADPKTSEQPRMHDLIARAVQFLIERDYFQVRDLPTIMRSLSSPQPQLVVDLIEQVLIRKVRFPDDVDLTEALAWMKDIEAMNASLRRMLRETEEYQQILEDWREKNPGIANNVSSHPDPTNVVGQLVFGAVLPNFGDSTSTIKVQLNLRQSPVATNGDWDASKQVVAWDQQLGNAVLPTFAYALWSEPDTKFQQATWGHTLLTDKPLAEYVIWYAALTESEKQHWDAFLNSERQTLEKFAGDLRKFSFDGNNQLADKPRSLLLNAIEKQTEN
ncbi:MAG: hypothetical protein R3C05_10700 [Pirellulaceae bacterium]